MIRLKAIIESADYWWPIIIYGRNVHRHYEKKIAHKIADA